MNSTTIRGERHAAQRAELTEARTAKARRRARHAVATRRMVRDQQTGRRTS
jgi:hypothetical protein